MENKVSERLLIKVIYWKLGVELGMGTCERTVWKGKGNPEGFCILIVLLEAFRKTVEITGKSIMNITGNSVESYSKKGLNNIRQLAKFVFRYFIVIQCVKYIGIFFFPTFYFKCII